MTRLTFRTASGLALLIIAARPASAQDGAASYKQNCASCHDAGVDRAPTREALQSMTAERVLAALESGAMISMASRNSAAERRAIAQFVTGKSLSRGDVDMTPAPRSMCAVAGNFTDPLTGPLWNGWGENTSNTRFQDGPGFTASEVARLKVKWAFGFPGDLDANAQPTVVGDRVLDGRRVHLRGVLRRPERQRLRRQRRNGRAAVEWESRPAPARANRRFAGLSCGAALRPGRIG